MDHTDGGTLGTSSITLPRESRSMLSRGPEPYTPKPLYARAQQGGRPMVMQARCTPSGPVVSAPCPGFVGGSMSCLWVLGSPGGRVWSTPRRGPGSAISPVVRWGGAGWSRVTSRSV